MDTVLDEVLIEELGEKGVAFLNQLVGQDFSPGETHVVLVDEFPVGEDEVLGTWVTSDVIITLLNDGIDVGDNVLSVLVVVVIGPVVVVLDVSVIFSSQGFSEGVDEDAVQVIVLLDHVGVEGINDVLDVHLVDHVLGLEHDILGVDGEFLHHQGESVQHTV